MTELDAPLLGKKITTKKIKDSTAINLFRGFVICAKRMKSYES